MTKCNQLTPLSFKMLKQKSSKKSSKTRVDGDGHHSKEKASAVRPHLFA